MNEDFDIEKVGNHCSENSCRQRDFLPLKCNHCFKFYCQNHFHYSAHTCSPHYLRSNSKGVDISSMECPLCLKSIKYDKNLIGTTDNSIENQISLIWQSHYETDCLHQIPKQNVKASCGKLGCKNILGPSNTFNCPKCRVVVCMSHRMPEDHNCSNTIREQRLKAVQASSTSIVSKKIKSTNKPKNVTNTVDPLNTLKGSAERRKQNNVENPVVMNAVCCPYCEYKHSDQADVDEHVNIFHLALYDNTSEISQSEPISKTLSEECPQCKMRFNDIVSLVHHVEQCHHSNTPGIAVGGNSSLKDCSLS
mmetsp:Transcript_2243/g.3043  ORF Transcript_2243/g.3043 Transcript_2243/m.3043 type:complete len:307 (+) Transcript_2243:31-951(+)